MSHDPNSTRPVAEREVREHTHTHTSSTKSGSGMAVIVAAIILVIAGLAYVMFSGDGASVTDGVDVNVDSSAPAEGGTAPAADAPAADSAAPADAGTGETAPAPAD